jgi:malonyl CoA-acyl carrier protein transacylase
MNTTVEAKSAAARFMDEHEGLQRELETTRLTIEDQRRELEKADATNSILRETLEQANADKNSYLQYAFELSAQLQFIVSGSARALQIAHSIRARIASQANGIPPVPGSDVDQLQGIINRIGDSNEAAGDGNGLTNGTMVDREGKPIAPPSATTQSLQIAS